MVDAERRQREQRCRERLAVSWDAAFVRTALFVGGVIDGDQDRNLRRSGNDYSMKPLTAQRGCAMINPRREG